MGLQNDMVNKRTLALGRMKAGVMNKLEAEFDKVLQQRLISGDILWYKFEGVTFNLAKGSSYTPDFAVLMANGQMEFMETKGVWLGDGKTKIKIAAELFPFQFRAIFKKPYKEGGGWKVLDF